MAHKVKLNIISPLQVNGNRTEITLTDLSLKALYTAIYARDVAKLKSEGVEDDGTRPKYVEHLWQPSQDTKAFAFCFSVTEDDNFKPALFSGMIFL
jgi:hypothetical protein